MDFWNTDDADDTDKLDLISLLALPNVFCEICVLSAKVCGKIIYGKFNVTLYHLLRLKAQSFRLFSIAFHKNEKKNQIDFSRNATLFKKLEPFFIYSSKTENLGKYLRQNWYDFWHIFEKSAIQTTKSQIS